METSSFDKISILAVKSVIRFYLKYLFCLVFLTCGRFIFSQTGNYFISNYSSNQYNGAIQNFDIVQDDFGLMYVANNSVLLEYNGKSWNAIHVLGDKSPVSLAKSDDGNIYVGSENEFGMLERNSKGRRHYRSLITKLGKGEKDFTQIWNTLTIKNDVFFCANERIIRYSNGEMKSWKPSVSFHKPQVVNGHLLVREVGVGLMCLKGDQLQKIEGSEILEASEFKIACFIPWKNENEYLIITRKKGVFHFFLDNADPVKSKIVKANEHMFKTLDKFEPYDGVVLDNGNIVIGSLDRGIFVFDRNFRLQQNLNSSKGCIDDAVRRLFVDRQENLWVAFNNGISRIEISCPLTKWDRTNQVQGSVESIAFYKGQCFLATSKGLLKLDTAERIFDRIGIADRCTDLKIAGGKLFIGSESGLWRSDGKNFELIYDKDMVNQVKYSPDFPDRVFCACSDGIAVIGIGNGERISEITSPLESDVLYLAFTSRKNILASTRSAGMYYCDPATEKNNVVPESPLYFKEHENFVAEMGGRICVGSDSGLILVDGDKFSSRKGFNRSFPGLGVSNFAVYGNEIYIHGSNGRGDSKTFCLLSDDEKNQKIYPVLGKLGSTAVRKFYFDSQYVDICTDDGVFILDRKSRLSEPGFQIYLSNMIRNGDTLICDLKNGSDYSPLFSFGNNRLIFEFGSNDFSDESRLLFQYYLEGYENGFNEWAPNHKALYDNIQLHEGQYVFHLRAKNIYGEISPEMILRFDISPPWYRTKIAYVIYVLMLGGLVWLIIAINTRRLKAQNKKLEKIIQERTHTIIEQKSEIEHKNKEITDSINYAQKIQLALMASSKLLDRNLKMPSANVFGPEDYFLLYEPKDIVSGDFYWAGMQEENGSRRFMVVAADCTGHGVPGAFMSLLCIGFLNEIIREKQMSDPGRIFDELRSRIISTLNPDGAETERKDGMDAVLIEFTGARNEMRFVAANNSFYVVRNKELLVMKADKMPVGKYSEENVQSFSTNSFALQKGDTVYAFTDGYADQFGGPKGKKFKYRQLEQLFIEICELPADQQKQILKQRFEEWRGANEQVDDVLVLGVKF
jgi:serine phosphatase RsbU (regulator of sigma subunit)